MQILKRLLGDGFAKLTDSILTGEERFNDGLIGARRGMLEETSGVNSEKYLEIIKTMKENSTDPVMVIRKMRVSPQPYKNFINYIVNSNKYRDIDLSDRRIFLPTISNKYQQNVEFFEDLSKKITDKSLQYVFNYFYTVLWLVNLSFLRHGDVSLSGSYPGGGNDLLCGVRTLRFILQNATHK